MPKELDLLTIDPRAYVRLEALKIASFQHARTNAVQVPQLTAYASEIEVYVWAGKSASVSPLEEEEDPLA